MNEEERLPPVHFVLFGAYLLEHSLFGTLTRTSISLHLQHIPVIVDLHPDSCTSLDQEQGNSTTREESIAASLNLIKSQSGGKDSGKDTDAMDLLIGVSADKLNDVAAPLDAKMLPDGPRQEEIFGEAENQTSALPHSSYRRDGPIDIADSLLSSDQSDTSSYSGNKGSVIEEAIEDILASPITPTSAQYKGPEGKPLGVEVATHAYHRGECSTGDLREEYKPEGLKPRRKLMTIENAGSCGLSTITEARKSISTEAECLDSMNESDCSDISWTGDQKPDKCYRSALMTGKQSNALPNLNNASYGDDNSEISETDTKNLHCLPIQGNHVLLQENGTPCPNTQLPERTRLMSGYRNTRPSALRLSPLGPSTNESISGFGARTRYLPPMVARSTTLLRPLSPATHNLHRRPFPHRYIPETSSAIVDGEIHPAYRHLAGSSPLGMGFADYAGPPASSTTSLDYHGGVPDFSSGLLVSPSLPAQKVPSTYLRSSGSCSSPYYQSSQASDSMSPGSPQYQLPSSGPLSTLEELTQESSVHANMSHSLFVRPDTPGSSNSEIKPIGSKGKGPARPVSPDFMSSTHFPYERSFVEKWGLELKPKRGSTDSIQDLLNGVDAKVAEPSRMSHVRSASAGNITSQDLEKGQAGFIAHDEALVEVAEARRTSHVWNASAGDLISQRLPSELVGLEAFGNNAIFDDESDHSSTEHLRNILHDTNGLDTQGSPTMPTMSYSYEDGRIDQMVQTKEKIGQVLGKEALRSLKVYKNGVDRDHHKLVDELLGGGRRILINRGANVKKVFKDGRREILNFCKLKK